MAELRPRDGGGSRPPMWTVWSLERAEKVDRMHRRVTDEGFRGLSGAPAPDTPAPPPAPPADGSEPARHALLAFLDSLPVRQVATVRFPMEHESRRHWMNGSRFYGRHGQCLEDLDHSRRALALSVVAASLGTEGYRQLVDVMRLNRTIGELRDELDVLNEWLYWFSVYGSPDRPGAPWGWQLDGHHLAVNCVVVDGRMTLTPSFLGAEPVVAEGGRYAGTRVFGPEEAAGAALFSALSEEQRARARIAEVMPPDLFTGAYRDNLHLERAGLCLADMSRAQRESAYDLIDLYVDRAPRDQAAVRRADVRAHGALTSFAFVGDGGPGGAFYYRVHSPVVLIEFEHMASVMFEVDEPWRNHVHTVVRTPNGGDYGVDLLRRHHASHHDGSGPGTRGGPPGAAG
ncbi:DUF3500 domain-containing protein [Streptomyces sp. NPDC090306]|uniref:DUF3500 domain-containing protein n=1 Tax=Streptomyces sp. NPDC090306 TaxID=3365961 RepID=UPI0038206B5C